MASWDEERGDAHSTQAEHLGVTLDAQASADVMDVIDDRTEVRSTIVTSQLPVSEWHSLIPDASIADALLDRLVHRAVRVDLKGESMRKKAPQRSPKLT